jgi:hypothetical protein
LGIKERKGKARRIKHITYVYTITKEMIITC